MKQRVLILLPLSIQLTASLSYGFDPFTVTAVVGSAANIISSISDTAGEVASSANAFQELYSELDTEARISQDGQKIVDQVQEIDSLAREAGYTTEEIDQLGHTDPNDVKKLSTTLRNMTQAIRSGKRAARLLSKLDQKAKTAEIESLQIEREELAAMYRIIRLQNEANLKGIKDELKETIERRNQVKSLRKELSGRGVQTFGKTGILAFPKQETSIEAAINVGRKMRPYLLSLLVFFFFARIVFYQFGFFGANSYGDLLRDVLLCSLLLAAYPEIVRGILSFTQGLASSFGTVNTNAIRPEDISLPMMASWSTKFKLTAVWLFEWVKYAAFTVIDFCMNFGIAFLVMVLPLVIFLSQMANLSLALPLFISGLIILCLWPMFWNMVGYMASLFWKKQDQTLAEEIYTILFTLFQLFSPIFGIKLLSGQPMSKAMSSTISQVSRPVTQMTQAGMNQIQGFWRGTSGQKGGGNLGRATGWGMNQLLSRTQNAVSHMRDYKTPDYMSSSRENPNGWTATAKRGARGFVLNQGPKQADKEVPSHPAAKLAQGLRFQRLRNQSRGKAR